jgi:hypothetical protein
MQWKHEKWLNDLVCQQQTHCNITDQFRHRTLHFELKEQYTKIQEFKATSDRGYHVENGGVNMAE